MKIHPNLSRTIPAGQPLRPWLALGPFYEDCSAQVEGLTLFERAGSDVGRALLAAAAEEAARLLAAAPTEGDEALFRGQRARWELVRLPEPYLSWGNYYIANHLGAVLLTTLVRPGAPGMRRWRLTQRINARALLTVGGAVVFDSDTQTPRRAGTSLVYEFEAPLPEGEQPIGLALLRLGRFAQVGARLELLDGDLDARAPLGDGVDPQERARIEAQVGRLSLGRDLFYPQDDVALYVASPAGDPPRTPMRVTLIGPEAPRVYGDKPFIPGAGARAFGGTPRTVEPGFAGALALARGADLPDSSFRILCEWPGADERPITQTSFEIRKVTPVPAIPGPERAEERRRAALEFLAHTHEWHPSPPVWNQVARYALGRYDEVDEGVLRAMCAFIAARKDCSDFAIQGLLRLLAWENRERRLSPPINALMKETVLGFKYWVDEPGDTVMYMGSENHRLLFHVAEWMAGQLFPTEEFTNSRERGLFHALKGRTFITEWVRQRGRFGFDEWHSNAYYPICIAPLLNVYDFAIAEDYKLKQMAGALLDVMLFNLAADSFRGTFGTTHGRSYGIYCKYADFDDTASTCWLLFGNGALVEGPFGMAAVSLASSAYRPPEVLYRIANDTEATVESRQRAGVLPGSARHADFVVYRTPDYTLSAVQDHRKGEYESSTHVAQITLPNKAAIFWSSPQTSGEGSGLRPDYWSGSVTLPRAVQHRNLLALHWRLGELAWMTHCLFEQGRFDEVRLAGGWAFARAENAYVAIWASGGLRVGDTGQYAGRELVCDARVTTWLAECGRAADWGTFERFVGAVLAAPLESDGDRLDYTSPSAGRLVSGWDLAPTLDGAPIRLRGYPLVESPWAFARFGSGEFVIRYGDEEYEVWLNQ
ncbi:MAG TPA: hypothetical protein VNL77_19055 [Roseiflexaceae bacterium]|nr:hypothetical protein [Roseiflexaceae bacterium]